MTQTKKRTNIIVIIYIVIGIIMASNRGYLIGLGSIDNIISAILAVALWPLLLFDVSLHIAL
jgi:hypothetical protein